MSFANLFTVSYWFSAPLLPSSTALWIMGIVWGLLVIGACFASYRTRNARDGITRGVWRRFAGWAWTMSILGWLLFFARYERIFIFNRRYWLLIWLIAAVWWLVFVMRHAKRRAPALSRQAEEEAFRERYLPKPKNG